MRSTGLPMASARRWISASSRPQQTVNAAENVIVDGSRPASSQAARTRSNWADAASSAWNGVLNSSAKRAASRGVFTWPAPPRMIGGRGDWAGLGRPGESATV